MMFMPRPTWSASWNLSSPRYLHVKKSTSSFGAAQYSLRLHHASTVCAYTNLDVLLEWAGEIALLKRSL